jgi:hypothetical protein
MRECSRGVARCAGGFPLPRSPVTFLVRPENGRMQQNGRVAQLVRALLSHSRGPGFESLRAHLYSKFDNTQRPTIIVWSAFVFLFISRLPQTDRGLTAGTRAAHGSGTLPTSVGTVCWGSATRASPETPRVTPCVTTMRAPA